MVYFVSVLSSIPRLEDTLVKDMDSNWKTWFVLDINSGKKTNNDIQYYSILHIIYCNNCVTFEQIFTS